MVNAKKIYNKLFDDARITEVISSENIFNAYPDEIVNFPCVIFLDEGQSDTEYSENMPRASSCLVEVHIFTKKIEGYISSANVAIIIAQIMNENLWNCSMNGEVADPDPNCEHRVMRFNKSIFN